MRKVLTTALAAFILAAPAAADVCRVQPGTIEATTAKAKLTTSEGDRQVFAGASLAFSAASFTVLLPVGAYTGTASYPEPGKAVLSMATAAWEHLAFTAGLEGTSVVVRSKGKAVERRGRCVIRLKVILEDGRKARLIVKAGEREGSGDPEPDPEGTDESDAPPIISGGSLPSGGPSASSEGLTAGLSTGAGLSPSPR